MRRLWLWPSARANTCGLSGWLKCAIHLYEQHTNLTRCGPLPFLALGKANAPPLGGGLNAAPVGGPLSLQVRPQSSGTNQGNRFVEFTSQKLLLFRPKDIHPSDEHTLNLARLLAVAAVSGVCARCALNPKSQTVVFVGLGVLGLLGLVVH